MASPSWGVSHPRTPQRPGPALPRLAPTRSARDAAGWAGRLKASDRELQCNFRTQQFLFIGHWNPVMSPFFAALPLGSFLLLLKAGAVYLHDVMLSALVTTISGLQNYLTRQPLPTSCYGSLPGFR